MTLIRSSVSTDILDFTIRLYALIAPASGTSVPVTMDASLGRSAVRMTAARYSGVSSATALASSCNSAACDLAATSSVNVRAQSITTAATSLLLCVGTTVNNIRTHTAQNGLTKRYDGSGTPFNTFQFLYDRVDAPAGTLGGAVNLGTMNVADQYISLLAAFPLA
jgi:hypothetical protein